MKPINDAIPELASAGVGHFVTAAAAAAVGPSVSMEL